MKPFSYSRPETIDDAIAGIGLVEPVAQPESKFIGGGTNLVDLMKANVMRPTHLVDVNHLPGLATIEATPDGGLMLGALVKNAPTAYDDRVSSQFPLVSKAILAGASAQLRNVASNGGNLNQRTRCYYFYDTATRCNKREPGSGCDAIGGYNRIHAILGASDQCIATHPSDLCVALAALGAIVHVTGSGGDRAIAFREYHRLPGDTPWLDNNLNADEVVRAIELPRNNYAAHSAYLKTRDRQSYAFALVSVAAALEMDGDTIKSARLALGGVAHKPWRDESAEQMLAGKPATAASFKAVATHVVAAAKGFEHNAFKIELARRAIAHALELAAAGTGAG